MMWMVFCPGFKKRQPYLEQYYDLREDWDLIESSFAAQYSIRLRTTNISWNEFCSLLSGLMPETPLGNIVSIRSEKNVKVIKAFNPAQKRIHREWQLKAAKNRAAVNPADLNKDLQSLNSAIKNMFGKR